MYRIIYKSRSRIPAELGYRPGHPAHQRGIQQFARHHRILLASNTHFLQVLEGNYEQVNSVFMRIVRDERHTDIRLLAFSVIDTRLFGGSGMHGIGAFDFNKHLGQQLIAKYGEEDGGIHFPLEEWQVPVMISDIRMTGDLPEWKK
jgi:hypothetical protein